MAGFKFVNSENVVFPITNENDEPIKSYTFNFGNEDFLRRVKEADVRLKENNEKFIAGDIDALLVFCKTTIDSVLGDGEFDFLFDKFDKNVYATFALIAEIFTSVKEHQNKRFDKYK